MIADFAAGLWAGTLGAMVALLCFAPHDALRLLEWMVS